MVLLSSCNAFNSKTPETTNEGFYEIVFDLGGVPCPTRWEISKNGVTIINGTEQIEVVDYEIHNDSASFVLPVFGTTIDFQFTSQDSLKGVFKNQFRGADYQIPFIGYKTTKAPILKVANSKTIYDVIIDTGTDSFKAIGVFNTEANKVTGTFLTETGDYRFLEGKKTSNNEFYLSCFDGSHLFYFTALLQGDSIYGEWYSGNHWNTVWEGVLNPEASLTDPTAITKLKEDQTSVSFMGINSDQDTLHFNSEEFNRVTIVQITGTWCPNCMDESRYYKELTKTYGDDLDIIALAFERPTDLTTQLNNIEIYRTDIGIDYPVYLAGTASKSDAAAMFSELNGISSFPTSIYIDKKGMVRKIHTGFYGPGTGEYYTNYVRETEAFLDELIRE